MQLQLQMRSMHLNDACFLWTMITTHKKAVCRNRRARFAIPVSIQGFFCNKKGCPFGQPYQSVLSRWLLFVIDQFTCYLFAANSEFVDQRTRNDCAAWSEFYNLCFACI
mgnify:CR=1 FL=1